MEWNFTKAFTGFADNVNGAAEITGHVKGAMSHEKGSSYGAGEVAAEIANEHGPQIAANMAEDSHHLESQIPGMSERAQETLVRMEARIAPEGSSFRFFRKMFARALFAGTRVAGFMSMSISRVFFNIPEDKREKALQRHAGFFSFLVNGATA